MAPIEGEFTIRKGIFYRGGETKLFKGQNGQDLTVITDNGSNLSVNWENGDPILRASGFVMGPHNVRTFDLDGNLLSEQSADFCNWDIKFKVEQNQTLEIERDGFRVKATRT